MVIKAHAPFHIRPAVPSDVPEIFRLSSALAAFQKAPKDDLTSTPELLHEALFVKKWGYVVLAVNGTKESPGELLGHMLYFFTFSTYTGKPTLFLEDFYLTSENRSGGVGKAMFGELGRIALLNDCARIDGAVLTWNHHSMDFYQTIMGGKQQEGWAVVRLDLPGIKRLQRFAIDDSSSPPREHNSAKL